MAEAEMYIEMEDEKLARQSKVLQRAINSYIDDSSNEDNMKHF
jgi:hypothetical protein